MPNTTCTATSCSSCSEPDLSRCMTHRADVESRTVRRLGQPWAAFLGDGAARRTRAAIEEYGSVICAACHRSFPPAEIHVDHRVPLADGGADLDSNIWLICGECQRGEASDGTRRSSSVVREVGQ
jgi:5-methylcytosine-specific restriction endonuclease McrA